MAAPMPPSSSMPAPQMIQDSGSSQARAEPSQGASVAPRLSRACRPARRAASQAGSSQGASQAGSGHCSMARAISSACAALPSRSTLNCSSSIQAQDRPH
jgi:hypothetical protein